MLRGKTMLEGILRMNGNKYTPRSLAVRCLVILAGIVIAGLGASCFVTANLGSDPGTACVQGIGNVTGLSFGMAMNAFNIFFFILILFMNRRMINIGMVLYTLLLGYAGNFFIGVMGSLLGGAPALWARIVTLVVGVLCVGIGLGIYQAAELGAGPSDAFNQTMAAMTGLPLRWERIIFDAVVVVAALVMGGVVHVGTIVGMLCVGPIMAPTITHGAKIVDRWAGAGA